MRERGLRLRAVRRKDRERQAHSRRRVLGLRLLRCATVMFMLINHGITSQTSSITCRTLSHACVMFWKPMMYEHLFQAAR